MLDLSSGKYGIIRTSCSKRRIMTFEGRMAKAWAPSWQIDCQDAATPVFVCWSSGSEMAVCDVDDTYSLRFGYDTQGRKTLGQATRDDGATWDETRWEFDAARGLNTAKVYADGSRIAYAHDTIGNRHTATANSSTNVYVASCLNQYASILRASQMLAHPSGSASPNLPFERNCQPIDPPRRRMRPIQRIFAHAVSSSFQMRVRFRRAKILNRPRLGLNAFCGKSVTGGDAPQENQVQRSHAGRVTLPQTCHRRIAYRAGASVPLTRQTAGAVPQHVSKPSGILDSELRKWCDGIWYNMRRKRENGNEQTHESTLNHKGVRQQVRLDDGGEQVL